MIKVTAPIRIDISAGWSDADPFRSEFGGAVLNAAINLRVSATLKNKNLTTSLEKAPPNSGLGTSGAVRTTYLVASNPSLIKDKKELIERVHIFENAIVGQRAGFQDQAAAIFGGVNYWEFRKDGSIHQTPITKSKAAHLLDRLVLIYTGDGHISANVHQTVFESKKYMSYIPIINQMKVIAKKMVKNITNEKVMADLINQTWTLQKTLHKQMEPRIMKKIQDACRGYYLAARTTGAGGGGCMIFYTNQKKNLIQVLKKANKKIPNIQIIPFKFDYKGIELVIKTHVENFK